jgi:glycosyltransferase involved in cell wall biosynthesis
LSLVVGIDASRNRSGGGIRHLVGILGAVDPREHGLARVHVWAYDALLAELPDTPWLVKHGPPQLRGSILRQIWWQYRSLEGEARAQGVNIMLNTDAGSLYRGRPSVTMSRDMLSYEPGEMNRYFPSRMWLRLLALRYVQAWSLTGSDGAIFLTRYAADVIQRMTGPIPRVAIIPHGIGPEFRRTPAASECTPLRCLYVSQSEPYKHQWHVVRAIAELRRRGHALTLTLAGGGSGKAHRRLQDEIGRSDPHGQFVTQIGFVKQRALPALLADADLFVFASSCENMPNTLVEGMASGLPIACSNRGPMPEVLSDAGVYFDPENPDSIASAVETLVVDPARRADIAQRAATLARDFSWERCARETWAFLHSTHRAATTGAR